VVRLRPSIPPYELREAIHLDEIDILEVGDNANDIFRTEEVVVELGLFE